MNASNSRTNEDWRKRKTRIGRLGEAVAREFLENRGYRIIETRYRKVEGEADIIARFARTLVFCEIKTRTSETIDREVYSKKQSRRMTEICQRFLAENPDKLPIDYDLRFDLIIVKKGEDGSLKVAEHLIDAFRPENF